MFVKPFGAVGNRNWAGVGGCHAAERGVGPIGEKILSQRLFGLVHEGRSRGAGRDGVETDAPIMTKLYRRVLYPNQ